MLHSVDITCYNDRGASYKGTVSYMGSGKVCSPWAGRHVHGITSGVSLDSNYCRNPDGSAKPWCFVNETGRGWEFCESIRRCGEGVVTLIRGDHSLALLKCQEM